MAMMTQAQIQAELLRKKNLGLQPSNAANQAAYNKLTTTAKPATTPAPAAVPNGQVGIRDYLTGKGVDNSKIGYAGGQVTVGGTGLLAPATNQGGKTYAAKEDLDKAYSSYQINQGQQKVNTLMGNLEKAIDTPYSKYEEAKPFAYNMYTDPAYQAAMQSALANAQTAQNNAMVGMGARGIGNSSSAVTASNQIQQNAYGAVTRDVLPQLMQQAYQRYADSENMRYQQYMDQYGMSQDKVSNLGNLVNVQSGLNQQLISEDQRGIDNAQQEWANRFNYGQAIGTFGNGQQTLAKQGQDFAQGMETKRFDSSEDQRGIDNKYRSDAFDFTKLESNRNYGLSKDDNARQWASYNLSKNNSAADNSRASSSQGFNQLMDIWRASGVAPAGIAGVQQGTPYGGQQQVQQDYDYRTDPSFAEDVASITANPSTALAEVQKNAKSIIQTYGYDAYQDLLKLATPKEE